MEEVAPVISELKGKFRSQGQQIITYRRKLRQQVSSISRRGVGLRSDLGGSSKTANPIKQPYNKETRPTSVSALMLYLQGARYL